MKLLFTIIFVSLMGCNSVNTAHRMNTFSIDAPTLPDHVDEGSNPLNRDSIVPADYPVLSLEQVHDLAKSTGFTVPDDTQIMGVRKVDEQLTLAAYMIPLGEDPNLFMVYLVIHADDGSVVDALNLRAFHTCEHDGPMRLGGNRFHTCDASLTFEDAHHFTLHRVMTLTSLYLKGHRLTELWRAEWDNHYEIDKSGKFRFTGQKETYHSEQYNEDIVREYMVRDSI